MILFLYFFMGGKQSKVVYQEPSLNERIEDFSLNERIEDLLKTSESSSFQGQLFQYNKDKNKKTKMQNPIQKLQNINKHPYLGINNLEEVGNALKKLNELNVVDKQSEEFIKQTQEKDAALKIITAFRKNFPGDLGLGIEEKPDEQILKKIKEVENFFLKTNEEIQSIQQNIELVQNTAKHIEAEKKKIEDQKRKSKNVEKIKLAVLGAGFAVVPILLNQYSKGIEEGHLKLQNKFQNSIDSDLFSQGIVCQDPKDLPVTYLNPKQDSFRIKEDFVVDKEDGTLTIYVSLPKKANEQVINEYFRARGNEIPDGAKVIFTQASPDNKDIIQTYHFKREGNFLTKLFGIKQSSFEIVNPGGKSLNFDCRKRPSSQMTYNKQMQQPVNNFFKPGQYYQDQQNKNEKTNKKNQQKK